MAWSWTYPDTPLDDASLLYLLGDFWATVYDGRQLVDDYVKSAAALERQMLQGTREWADLAGLATAPTYGRTWCEPLQLDPAARINVVASTLGEDVLGDGSLIGATSTAVSYPIDSDIKAIVAVGEKIQQPEMLLVHNIDYYLDLTASRIIFAVDPLEDSRVFVDSVTGLGTVWAQSVDRDRKYLYTHYGSVFGLQLGSSDAYREFLLGLSRSCAGGPTYWQFLQLIAAATGVPCVKNATEAVEVVTTDATGRLVITDQEVYRFETADTVRVAVGDTLTAGTWMTDAVQVYDLTRGELPPAADVPEIEISTSMLPAGFTGSLTFENADKAVAGTVVGGELRVTFEVGGAAADVTAFFDAIHSRGLAAGRTLADYLDVRDNPTTEPILANMPATVNPAQLLIENVLRWNAWLVCVRPASFPDSALGLAQLESARDYVSPHHHWIIVSQ